MSRVALVGCPSYQEPQLSLAVARAVDLAGGPEAVVPRGGRVLLKPNMLAAHRPEERVTTDPAVVRAVARLVMDAGAKPFIADSPALAPFGRVAAKSGLADVAKELGIEIMPLIDPTPVSPPEPAVHKTLHLARAALEADAIINLPKLKAHGQMLMTLGVKNLFGTVVAQRKAEWHYMVGMDRAAFADLILDICRAVDPGLTILDGVWGMEGRGPANGRPVEVGLVAASTDPLALDLAVCDVLGVERRHLPLFRAAQARGLLPEAVDAVGDDPATLRPASFEAPRLEALDVLPGPLSWLTRRYLVSRPVCRVEACQGCGQCVEICPASALSLKDGHAAFDHEACIRCYCCQEICPDDAIDFKTGLLQRLLLAMGR